MRIAYGPPPCQSGSWKKAFGTPLDGIMSFFSGYSDQTISCATAAGTSYPGVTGYATLSNGQMFVRAVHSFIGDTGIDEGFNTQKSRSSGGSHTESIVVDPSAYPKPLVTVTYTYPYATNGCSMAGCNYLYASRSCSVTFN